jgi:hypothetical protein
VVGLTNLIEAEGRSLKVSVIRVAAGLVGLLLALVLGVGGLGMMAAAMYTGLVAGGVTVGWAWFIVGLLFLLASGGVAWLMVIIAGE